MQWLKDALPIDIQQQTDPKQTRDEIRTSVTDERQWQTFVRQERRGYANVDRRLQSQKRNNAAAKKQSESVFGMQRDHDPANNDDHKQKDHEQAEPQTELFADNRENEICMRVRQIKHLLSAIAQAKPFHSPTAPGDEGLHLLQTSIFFKIFRMNKSAETTTPFLHLRAHNDNRPE